ncbi:MAG TPA: M20/M25/M40 family metallo-hydrolase, partial [Pirellulaceae bacterium]|nr:M20/M25/M40 family metallo-hydrolase [Pirellulaceae bacterium]
MGKIEQYIESNRQRFVDDLCEWLRMASVSTDPKYKPEVERAADWLLKRFTSMGLTAERIETSGHPLVYAETPAVPGAPVVLVYGHYDVQPPDPLNEWITPPFEPSIRDGNVYARGATDDKGQMITHVFSTEAWIKTGQKLPVQLKFLIEGEEECGGLGLSEFLNGKLDNGVPALDRIKADIAVISDCAQYGPGQPAITYGLRGIMYFELRLTGPSQDLHSGNFGGSVMNPGIALCQMLGGMIDSRGRIQVPGFYDDVIDLTENERQQFADLN